MKDNRLRYNDPWFEEEIKGYKYRCRRKMRHFERDMKKFMQE